MIVKKSPNRKKTSIVKKNLDRKKVFSTGKKFSRPEKNILDQKKKSRPLLSSVAFHRSAPECTELCQCINCENAQGSEMGGDETA